MKLDIPNLTVPSSESVTLMPDPTTTMQKTLQLLLLPDIVNSIGIAIGTINKKVDAILDFQKNYADSSREGYLTPEEAMRFLSMSKSTFEKYRYKTNPKIPGYQLDGKSWFKKSDLDRFMLTYKIKQLS